MKVLIYSHDFAPVLGGVPIVSRILAEGLTAAGHEVVIFTTTLESESDSERPYEVVRSAWGARLFAASHGADVILANGFSRRAGLVALLTSKPLVIIHQMADNQGDRAYRQSTRLSAWVERASFAAAACHIGVSEACLKSKDLDGSTRKTVVYNPIDPAILASKQAIPSSLPPKTQYDLLFAGRLIDGKGVHVLMTALRQLDADGCALRVCIAGSGPDADRLHAESALLKHVTVDFPGALDREGMAHAYASSRLFVIPSSTHQEGMPLVVAEALYFGLPIIGSNQEMIMEGMGAAGLSFESGNAAELADKIRTLVKDDELYNRLSRRAQDRSSQFLPDHFLSAVQDVLHDATDAPRRTNERPLYPDASPQADPTPN